MSTSPIQKPTPKHFMVDDKNRKIALHGFSNEGLFEHLNDHNLTPHQYRKSSSPEGYHAGDWCDTECLARTFQRRASDENTKMSPGRFSRAGRWFLDKGMLLLRDYSGRYGSIRRAKIFDKNNSEDQKWAETHRNRLLEDEEVSAETLAKLDAIIGKMGNDGEIEIASHPIT